MSFSSQSSLCWQIKSHHNKYDLHYQIRRPHTTTLDKYKSARRAVKWNIAYTGGNVACAKRSQCTTVCSLRQTKRRGRAHKESWENRWMTLAGSVSLYCRAGPNIKKAIISHSVLSALDSFCVRQRRISASHWWQATQLKAISIVRWLLCHTAQSVSSSGESTPGHCGVCPLLMNGCRCTPRHPFISPSALYLCMCTLSLDIIYI
jgi:hypothetical protein